MLAAEVALAAATAAWLALILRGARPAVAGQRRLERLARRSWLASHDVHIVPNDPRRSAFVIGPLRPQIFVSDSLVEVLDGDEMRAVILHEEHHRRQRDPLRGLALASWEQLLAWLPPSRRWIKRRYCRS